MLHELNERRKLEQNIKKHKIHYDKRHRCLHKDTSKISRKTIKWIEDITEWTGWPAVRITEDIYTYTIMFCSLSTLLEDGIRRRRRLSYCHSPLIDHLVHHVSKVTFLYSVDFIYFRQKIKSLFRMNLNPVAFAFVRLTHFQGLFYKFSRLYNFHHFVDFDVLCLLGNFYEVCHSSGIILYNICVFFCFASLCFLHLNAWYTRQEFEYITFWHYDL